MGPSNVQYDLEWFISNAHKIEQWFDPNLFNANQGYAYLFSTCMDSFDLWWKHVSSPDDDYDNSYIRCAQGTERFDDWFIPNRFDWKHVSEFLCIHLADKFDKWFDQNTFNTENAKDELFEYCYEHIDKWFDPIEFDGMSKEEYLVNKLYGY